MHDPSVGESVRYRRTILPHSVIHTLWVINTPDVAVRVAVAPSIDTLANFARQHRAIAALNAGFFDPVNGKTTSFVSVEGELVADPRQNERLVGNPALVPYMTEILNRSEFRHYLCQNQVRYDIAQHDEPTPAGCRTKDTVGGGPRLLPGLALEEEGFAAWENGQIVRDALGSQQRNARTAVGITASGDVVWVVAAKIPAVSTPSGMTMQEMADFLQQLGAVEALNLDGGSSSSLYYRGDTFSSNGGASGTASDRPVKSVLLVNMVRNGR
jgi:hypothetical protein